MNANSPHPPYPALWEGSLPGLSSSRPGLVGAKMRLLETDIHLTNTWSRNINFPFGKGWFCIPCVVKPEKFLGWQPVLGAATGARHGNQIRTNFKWHTHPPPPLHCQVSWPKLWPLSAYTHNLYQPCWNSRKDRPISQKITANFMVKRWFIIIISNGVLSGLSERVSLVYMQTPSIEG